MVTPAPHKPGPETTTIPAPPLPTLVNLLTTWQLWTYRDHLAQQIAAARQAHDAHRVFLLTRQLDAAPSVTALKALAANHRPTTLLLAGYDPPRCDSVLRHIYSLTGGDQWHCQLPQDHEGVCQAPAGTMW